jgi:hypothetical protein
MGHNLHFTLFEKEVKINLFCNKHERTVNIYKIVHDTEPSRIMTIRKTKHEGNNMKVTLVKLVRHDDQNCDLDQ